MRLLPVLDGSIERESSGQEQPANRDRDQPYPESFHKLARYLSVDAIFQSPLCNPQLVVFFSSSSPVCFFTRRAFGLSL
jgi:hypothetical protein